MAWNPNNPSNDELLSNFPALCRANWVALEAMTESVLLITNAKISPTAAILDSRLAQITTAGKVSGAALTLLSNVPSGAGVLPDANLPHKLRADASDTTPQYLDSLIDTNIFQISAEDLLQLKDAGVGTEKLINGLVSPGNSKYYGTNSGGIKGFFSLASDHGILSGLGDDDHSQYLNVARHDITTRHPESVIASSAISRSKLKVSAVEHSLDKYGIGTAAAHVDINAYGFWPMVRCVLYEAGSPYAKHMTLQICYQLNATNSTYMAKVYMSVTNGEDAGGVQGYIYQTYITTSGKDHFVFFLVEKLSKRIVRAYQCSDHPCVHIQATPEKVLHPFGDFDKNTYEVVLIDNKILEEAGGQVTREKSLLEVLSNDYEIDFNSNPIFMEREIIQIDEYGDISGELVEKIKTPDWAKIRIKSDNIQLKRKILKTLPSEILYKQLKKK